MSTRAIQYLKQKGVAYCVVEYEHSEKGAKFASQALGIPLEKTIKTLTQNYDFVLLDTPAFIDGSDALLISKHAQDILFILEQGKTSEKKARDLMEVLSRSNIKVLGCVLNKVRE